MKILFRLILLIVFLGLLIGVIAYARGYRFDFKEKSLKSTGILAVTSSPKAAKVYINGQLKGATDLNTTLPPGKYTVEIKKDGYTTFTKSVNLKGEIVESVDGILFPINPSLSPLTNLGIVKAIRANQTDKILLFSQHDPASGQTEKDGIYLFEAGKKPLSFLPPLKTIILKKNLPESVDLKNSKIYFSPDYKEGVFEFTLDNDSTISYLLSLEETSLEAFEVTNSKDTLLTAWEEEKAADTIKILETFPKEIRKVASDSFSIIAFAPDETKVLYRAKKSATLPKVINPPLIAANQTQEQRSLKINQVYVYDKKEDKNFLIKNAPLDSIVWFPNSKNLVIKEKQLISVIGYDDQNKQTVYSGPFEPAFFSTSSDERLLVLLNLNPQANKLPDLYSVGIR